VTACYDAFWNGDDVQSHYIEAWRRVAERLSGYDNVVGFDIFNEPYWGSHPIEHFEPDLLEPFYEKVVPVVRAAAPGWVAFVEPSSSRNLGGTTYLPTPSFANYVYAPHSYDTNAESGGGFDPSHAPAIRSNIAALAREAKNLGTALWIGEYGGSDTESGIVQYMTAQYDGAGAVAASSMYWDYTKGGYGILGSDGSPSEPLLETLVRPYPERVAGDPVSWTFEPVGAIFTLTYHSSASVTAPTIVSMPARVYPQGYVVSCGGCQTDVQGGSLVVSTPPPGDPAVLTIEPLPHG
jgi:endoglycosylceramidase